MTVCVRVWFYFGRGQRLRSVYRLGQPPTRSSGFTPARLLSFSSPFSLRPSCSLHPHTRHIYKPRASWRETRDTIFGGSRSREDRLVRVRFSVSFVDLSIFPRERHLYTHIWRLSVGKENKWVKKNFGKKK